MQDFWDSVMQGIQYEHCTDTQHFFILFCHLQPTEAVAFNTLFNINTVLHSAPCRPSDHTVGAEIWTRGTDNLEAGTLKTNNILILLY